MKKIKAIPTTYNGVKYRSRLEARWAVFFDQLGLTYFYEYEGFQLPSGWYVPDFYLPGIRDGLWVEIKPKRKPTKIEIQKCSELSEMTGKDVLLWSWDVERPLYDDEMLESFAWDEEILNKFPSRLFFEGDFGWMPSYLWDQCGDCGAIDLKWTHDESIQCNDTHRGRCQAPCIDTAYREAQRWRFH